MLADLDEREQALDPSRSFIVEAPAGSGKTGLLVQRFLRLLGVVERPESIVAMTFMRKAAAEMRERIYESLLAAHNGAPVGSDFDLETRNLALDALAQDQRKSWNLLSDPGRLQIQTIDSVSGMLARQMPVISEFGGESKIVEDARELYRRAARDTLRDMTEGDEHSQQLFHRLALHFDNDMQRLEIQVAGMLEKRDQWEFLASCEQLPLIDDFRELLNKARHALEQVFRRTGKIDFAELTRAARKALGSPENPTDLLYALDYRIEHLLVDEFQDTSRAQYELLDALTGQWSDGDGRTLFLVGDPMQSILRFREAEVGLFLRCWALERLGSVRLTPLRLTTNFRSTAPIVEWVENQFAAIMPEDDRRLGAVKFRHSVASRGGGATPQLLPLIEDSGQAEASEIVRILNKTSASHTVGILVRSRAHVIAILPALRNAGIPYQAIEIDQLAGEQHVLDVISLARAISHVGDRVSWLACLRAPWCGLTLADLATLAEGQSTQTILDLLSDPDRIALLSPQGRARAIRTTETLREAVARFGREPLRKLVESTWYALGGPAALQETNQHADIDTILDLLEDLEEGGVIRDFSLLGPRLEFLYAKPSSDENRIQVMTIHSAKGLEFDTVIVPQLQKETRTSDRELLVWTEETQADGSLVLSIAAQPAKGEADATYKEICAEIDKKEAHELGRLFYVACTRARNELFLLGSVRTKKNGAECGKPSGTTFLGLIWSSVEEQFQGKLRSRVPVQQLLLPLKDDAPRTILARLPADWQPPRVDTPGFNDPPPLRRAAASARKASFEWAGDTSRHIGTVVHELLKRNGPQLHSTQLPPIVKSELLRLGVPRAEESDASARVLRAFANTLESERGRWILETRAEDHFEWPIAGRIQDRLVSGTIDRVFRDEQDRLWIVDFKIGDHKGGKLGKFLDEEQRRYREQLESYAILLSRMAPGPIWLGLYFPLLDGWREWAFTEEAVAAGYAGE